MHLVNNTNSIDPTDVINIEDSIIDNTSHTVTISPIGSQLHTDISCYLWSSQVEQIIIEFILNTQVVGIYIVSEFILVSDYGGGC